MFFIDLLLPAPFLQFGSFALLFTVLYFFWRPKRSTFRKPFAADSRRPREPLEHDQKKRALRLKQRFMPNAVPTDIDAIVVGSGAGGLCTAAILAKSGRRCLVLEQHDQAGGCCHTFIENGYEWDVGIHYIGQMAPTHFDRFYLDQLTEGQLDWHELDDDFDNVVLVKSPEGASVVKQETVPICKDRTKLLETLIKRYPAHEAGIREFFELMQKSAKGMIVFAILKLMPYWLANIVVKLRLYAPFTNAFHMYHEISLKAELDRLFGDNEELKTVLPYCWGDWGVEPSRSGFGMLSVLYQHYAKGGFYPVGGASEIAYTLIPVIEKAGGKVLVNANVTDILLSEDGRKAVGVRVAHSSGPVEIKAPIVISDAGVSNTFKKLLPKEIAASTRIGRLLESGRIRPGVGTMQVFVGIQGGQDKHNLPAKNLWIYFENDIDKGVAKWNNLDFESAADSKIPFLFVGFPSAKDPSFNERFPGRSVCTIVTVAPMEWFQKWEGEQIKKRSGDYEAAKMRMARRAWDAVCQLYPTLSDHMDYIDAGSPLSTAYYINAYAGETYGLEADLERFAPDVVVDLRPDVPEIKNLYLTGQDILLCGFASVLYSAIFTGHAIMRSRGECSNLLDDVKALYRRHRSAPGKSSSSSSCGKVAANGTSNHCSSLANGCDSNKDHEE